jgi:hypothetical protein
LKDKIKQHTLFLFQNKTYKVLDKTKISAKRQRTHKCKKTKKNLDFKKEVYLLWENILKKKFNRNKFKIRRRKIFKNKLQDF